MLGRSRTVEQPANPPIYRPTTPALFRRHRSTTSPPHRSTPLSHATQFRVISKRLERLVAMTNWDYYEATQRFDRVLDATGVLEALGKAGAKVSRVHSQD